ncbi:hypothetical protein [Adhaeribacter aquaticus]|uniref:hypothetical protein n=1 Tax=Adhaeribacter aquaticus TaxID=299567 RepID=UPI0004217729|nr:hypothetical protein [Adhaeribacter aquaticus]
MAIIAQRDWGNYRFTIEQNGNTISVTYVFTDAETELIVRLRRVADNTIVGAETFPVNSSGFASTSFPDLEPGSYYVETTAPPDGTVGDSAHITVESTGSETPGGEEPEIPETPGTGTAPATKYHAVGGVLSNPIEYKLSFGVTDSNGEAKINHHVKVNIYREKETQPFAKTRQRIRNGEAVVDVSEYVKVLVNSNPAFSPEQIISVDTAPLAGFYIGFEEHFGETVLPEVKISTVRYAVNAALQTLDGNYDHWVVNAPGSIKELVTLFKEPVKFPGYPCSLGIIIDETLKGTALYFQRRYLDINREELQIKSTLIDETLYGKYTRFAITDSMASCAYFIEASITDTNINTEGTCPDESYEIPDDPDNPETMPESVAITDVVLNGTTLVISAIPFNTTKAIEYRLNAGSWQASTVFADLAPGKYNAMARLQGTSITDMWPSTMEIKPEDSETPTSSLVPSKWGWSAADPYGSLAGGNDIIAYQGEATYGNNAKIEADYHLMPSQSYAVLRVPSTHAPLTSWQDTGSLINAGTIPDQIFRAGLTVGNYTYYVSRVPLDFSTGPTHRVIFN